MRISKLLVLFMTMVFVLSSGVSTFSQSKSELKNAQKRIDSASQVMTEIMKTSDKAIPKEILEKAKAVIVFPGVIKAAFIVGGQGGKGVAIRKTKDGWSAPAFLNIGGGSFGFQIGGQKTDYILVVMNDNGLKGLLEDKFEFGAEASVAAGPVGRTTAATTNATLDTAILSYSRSKGAFAGVALKGAVVTQDNKMNKAIYKKTALELLTDPVTPWTKAPKGLQKFPQTVAVYAKKI